MTDREKVLRGLECCIRKMEGERVCDECPYDEDFNCLGCSDVLRQAITLLKEQNGVKPSSAEWLYDRPHHFRCSACGNNWGLASMKMRYCPDCGSKMFLSETERRKEWPEEGDNG